MNYVKKTFCLLVSLCFFISCFEDIDDNPISTRDLNDFIWKGMNTYYLYKDQIPDLANDRFLTDDYGSYLNSFSSPEDLFESLIYERETIDRFSWIVNDYIALEQLLSGTTLNNGMEFGLISLPQDPTEFFGYVRYVIPGSNADMQGVERGQLFRAINGSNLNETNYRDLISLTSYTINLATYNTNSTTTTNDDSVDPNGESIQLTKTAITENPVFNTNIFEVNGENVGYLMYNGFTPNFNELLNTVFGGFVANNVQHLVLDLRYNPGGSVRTAILLSSMISGNNGEVFSTEEWNSDIQPLLDPESLINRFTNNDNGVPLSTLNLSKVYVLTTRGSASASELVINGLNPYLDVIQIGTRTRGKYQASFTLYDSPDFTRQGVNSNHNYALQPLVLKEVNSVGFTDYDNGLIPEIFLPEHYGNLGELGNPNEPLLAAALQHIEDSGRLSNPNFTPLNLVVDSKDMIPFAKGMYIEKLLPKEIVERLKHN